VRERAGAARGRGAAVALGLALAASSLVADAQSPRTKPAPKAAAPGAHAVHGTPAGWTFTLPRGDARKGREVFEKLECFSCHEVKGERFPAPTGGANLGPELAAMAGAHPPEFFAEAILNPGAVIDKGHGYEAADGSSRMPQFNDSLTVQELIDLVAYLTSLKPPAGASPHRH
jgi:cytochrome c1